MTEQRTSAVAAFFGTLWGKLIGLLTVIMMLVGIYVELIQASKITIDRDISAVELQKKRAELPAYTGRAIDLSPGPFVSSVPVVIHSKDGCRILGEATRTNDGAWHYSNKEVHDCRIAFLEAEAKGHPITEYRPPQ
jgi:hypothetical protein